ncbi:MAG TPA: hypothetical protein PLA65_17595 [Spirochaetota bacterium]|nr:hypothetical protein [Spirochaetota bacterium]HPN13877.1 hypothetical protein [Spirochaetota bacterium]
MQLFVTIDTEPDCDIAWRRSSPLTFSSVTSGIPKILRPIWDRHDVKPIYYVSPEVVRDDECCRVLKSEIMKGAVIGTHLHSEYIEPHISIQDPAGKVSGEFPCYAHDTRIEHDKIANLTRLIETRLDFKPVWYRAARYGADLDTIHILKDLGYKYDSSLTPGINWSSIGGPDHSRAPVQPYWISAHDLYEAAEKDMSTGIMEYPITITGKRLGALGRILPDSWLFYKWMRPTHMSVWEQKRIIIDLSKTYADPVFTLIFHSMEIMINKTPFVRNRLMQRRFVRNLESIVAMFSDSDFV